MWSDAVEAAFAALETAQPERVRWVVGDAPQW